MNVASTLFWPSFGEARAVYESDTAEPLRYESVIYWGDLWIGWPHFLHSIAAFTNQKISVSTGSIQAIAAVVVPISLSSRTDHVFDYAILFNWCGIADIPKMYESPSGGLKVNSTTPSKGALPLFVENITYFTRDPLKINLRNFKWVLVTWTSQDNFESTSIYL